ncbi:MAG TPA: tRNA dihydrouridine(20/20a) synthase DusA, partial [Buchnera sp. (in: enterobacteria)]|nr:tRNA dihydrouridine(20/20a) synthase DusA [Buchnera sp. (in: enterobacteria)]
KYCRAFYRQLTKHALLYTEMITTNAMLNQPNYTLLYNHKNEHPIAIQLAGNIPKQMAECAKIAEKQKYNEINLNIGCPSQKAQMGCFGACLMKNTNLVIDMVKSIQDSVSIPISIKTRIGIDKNNNYAFLSDFVGKISLFSQCKKFIIHARTAILKEKNNKKNRTIPKLNYQYVYQLKKDFQDLSIIINGGIQSIEEAKLHLYKTDGVMIGRAIYKNPLLLSIIDSEIYNDKNKIIHNKNIIHQLYPYIEEQITQKQHNNKKLHYMFGLLYGKSGSNKWKQLLTKYHYKENNHVDIKKQILLFLTQCQF